MEDLLKTFTIPDNTTMEEHSIVTTGGAIIGNHTVMGFGIIANSVIAGERVRIKLIRSLPGKGSGSMGMSSGPKR